MTNNSTATGLVQTWVPVTDLQGRTHLEAHWIDTTAPATPVTHAA
ncbi:hypothetical protein [Nocardioides sp. URHA0020]|nr:hypothetical protein [Nocardioides sp. URHA0020]